MKSLASETIPEETTGKDSNLKKTEKLVLKDYGAVPSSEVERANLYYDLKEENGKLKEKMHEYEADMKRMATSLIRLQTQLGIVQTKTAKTKGHRIGDTDDMGSLLNQNKELKDRVRRTDAVLRSMHVSFQYKS
jgi:predicted nuclease with TOPRIM domain